MKIVFFDTKNIERSFFDGNLIFDNLKIIYFHESLNFSTFLSEDVLDADILCVFPASTLGKEILEKFYNLKFIVTRSVGFSHIDTEYCAQNGIRVATAQHYGDNTVAEYSFSLLLNLLRNICPAAHDVRYGTIKQSYTGEELHDKTIGILGTGAIGSKSVKIAHGFGMNILATDISPKVELEDKYGVEYVSLEKLCAFSDVIMLHSPLTKDNYHIIDAGKISLMKSNAVIVNTARGELIDTKALYNALLQKKIRGAALEVVECEELFMSGKDNFDDEINSSCLKKTLINHVLLNLQNVIITPHIAYDTANAVGRILELTLQNISEFLKNKPVTNELSLHK